MGVGCIDKELKASLAINLITTYIITARRHMRAAWNPGSACHIILSIDLPTGPKDARGANGKTGENFRIFFFENSKYLFYFKIVLCPPYGS